MQPQSNPTAHSAAGLSALTVQEAIRACAPWSVTSLEVLPGYKLRVGFYDGLSGIVDMSRLILSPDAGVFAALADKSVFAQAFISHGAVTWPGDLDVAPDAMHEAIVAKGEWLA